MEQNVHDSATIDIHGTKITGGEYKFDMKAIGGSPCVIFDASFDGPVTGGVDPTKGYGQLVVDGRADVVLGRDVQAGVTVQPTARRSPSPG